MKNRFGMFIHWGLYAQTGLHEQALSRYDMDYTAYEALKDSFDPVEYDPDEWVSLAKAAGMEYICFTTKHHDGFCLWDTKATDYNIMNTPYGKDALALLAEACKKQGMRLSLYYSLPDWHHEAAYNELASPMHQWKSKSHEKADKDAYIAFVKTQITELLTGYGEIYTLFWDIPPCMEDKSVNELARRLQPQILINNRGYDEGDFATPEREVPSGERFTHMTEACQSVGEQAWGYRAEEDYFSARFLASSIDKIMAMGGSYLLNVGPMASGKIPEQAKALIEKVGSWYVRAKEGLTDTEAPAEKYALFGNTPYVVTEKNGYSYFHFYNGLPTTAFTFADPTVRKPRAALLLNSGKELTIRHTPLPMKTENFIASTPYYSVTGIPVDDYAAEPLVVRVLWE